MRVKLGVSGQAKKEEEGAREAEATERQRQLCVGDTFCAAHPVAAGHLRGGGVPFHLPGEKTRFHLISATHHLLFSLIQSSILRIES